MQKEIRQTWHFKKPPEEVWEYLTKPELIEQWLGKTDFQPIAGFKFRFISPYDNHSYCEVLEVKPYTRLSYSWIKNSAKDNQPIHSIVEWTLIPNENGTDLHLLHSGFTAMEDVAAHERGWNACQIQFEDLLNSIL